MDKRKHLVSAALLLAAADSGAWLFTSDGSSFEECMEKRRADIKNMSQHSIAADYCHKKHPLPPAPIVDPFAQEKVDLYLVYGTDANSAPVRSKLDLISIARVALEHDGSNDYGYKSLDFKWYSGLTVNNRNAFPLSAVIVGLPKPGVRQCSWNEADYPEVYSCRGRAEGKTTGQFKCYIPGVEKRKLNYCLIGLGIEGTLSDVGRYLKSTP